MDLISSQQRQAAVQTLQARQALNTIVVEQAQWPGSSSVLSETPRAQVATLLDMPKPQQLDGDTVQLRVQRLRFENQLEKLPQHQFI